MRPTLKSSHLLNSKIVNFSVTVRVDEPNMVDGELLLAILLGVFAISFLALIFATYLLVQQQHHIELHLVEHSLGNRVADVSEWRINL
jgi:hypothetical protein